MLHYHGTPITPRKEMDKLKGRNFCVSYAQTQDANWCIENAQSIMWDNGAFSAYTRGKEFNKVGYMNWLNDKLHGANWAVVPDVIGGTVEDQRAMMKTWHYPDHLSCYVWHMDLPLDWLKNLVENYPRVAFGSSGKYWQVNSPEWQDRADDAWDVITGTGTRPWVHMMRGLKVCGKRWPFASADSTNVARNFKNKGREKCPRDMVSLIDSRQSPLEFRSGAFSFGKT
jgi:hypothetical protein